MRKASFHRCSWLRFVLLLAGTLIACLVLWLRQPDQPTATQSPAVTAKTPAVPPQRGTTIRELIPFSQTTSWPLTSRQGPRMINRPKLPPPPPVPEVLLADWQTAIDPLAPLLAQTEYARITWIIEHHPDRQLSQAIKQAGESGKLILTTKHVLMEGAQFNANGLPSTGPGYIVFYTTGLVKAKTNKDFLEIMLSLSHEYVHYERWLKASPEDDNMMNNPRQHQSEFCQFKWQDERDAIATTCPLNLRWGLLDGGRAVCLYANDPREFDHAYFMLVLMQVRRFGLASDPGANLCLQQWAEIAGHPNPSEFK